MQKICPCLWFDTNADEAADFYVSVFSKLYSKAESKILSTMHYGDAGPMPKGTVLSVNFLLHGQEYMALNGGPAYKFNPSVSFFIKCKTQDEVNALWEHLSVGGEIQQCGWLQDKYGLSWQIVPTILGEYLQDKDPEKSKRVMNAMLQMKKIEIRDLEKAYKG